MVKRKCKLRSIRSDQRHLYKVKKTQLIAIIQHLEPEFHTGDPCCYKCIKKAKRRHFKRFWVIDETHHHRLLYDCLKQKMLNNNLLILKMIKVNRRFRFNRTNSFTITSSISTTLLVDEKQKRAQRLQARQTLGGDVLPGLLQDRALAVQMAHDDVGR